MKDNLCIRIIDEPTGKVINEHRGHNAATNTLLTGIAHHLLGESLSGQGEILSNWIPQYISLGTMGLSSQDVDENGLPTGIGPAVGTEQERFNIYLSQCPGYGSDGYDTSKMNGRPYAGLGPQFSERPYAGTVDCELVSNSFPRAAITYRAALPEYESEYPKTIDVVFSALVSTGALAQFREPGKDYILISEVGLWSRKIPTSSGENGLLAGYRICPPDESNWDMSVAENRNILKRNIIRIGTNQVAQIIWKIQLGGLEQLGGLDKLIPQEGYLSWKVYT